jgi:hypothetical protein
MPDATETRVQDAQINPAPGFDSFLELLANLHVHLQDELTRGEERSNVKEAAVVC